MDRLPLDRQQDAPRTAPIGPAVRSRRVPARDAAAALASPLPPFVRPRPWPAAVEAAAHAEAPPVPEPVEEGIAAALEEMVAAEPEDDLDLVRGADWGLARADEELLVEVTDLLWEEASEEPEPLPQLPASEPGPVAQPAPEPAPSWSATAAAAPSEAPPMESRPADAAEAWSLAASVTPAAAKPPVPSPDPRVAPPEPAAPPSASAAAALAAAMPLPEGPALQEVAGRLERIASALREGRPIELFSSGSSDPLEVLIAGYALGYSEAVRRAADDRRRER